MRLCLLPVFLIAVCSCNSDPDIALPAYQPKVVVEGFIEQGKFPKVYLTLSSGFYDPVDSVMLRNFVLATAKVKVSDGENEEVLTLFGHRDKFPPFYYRGTDLRGEVGKTYTLEVVSNGETYTAETTIPHPVKLDSAGYEYLQDSDSLASIWITFQDDPDEDNYYRVFSQTRSTDSKYIPVYQSVLADKFFDDSEIHMSLLKGSESITDIESDVYYQKGDTVSIRFCTMDIAHFDFWRTLERELYLTGNPFGSAGNEILSNISGTAPALGVWGGYGADYYQVILK